MKKMTRLSAFMLCLAAFGCSNGTTTRAPTPVERPAVAPEPPAPPTPPTPPPQVEPPREAQQVPAQQPAPPAIPAGTITALNSLAVCSSNLPGYPAADCDGDEVLNRVDVCANEDADGDEDNPRDASRLRARRGCPQGDRDHDGYGDERDHCPDVPMGDHDDGFGCPDRDSDGDGVYDNAEHPDQCRTRPVRSDNHPHAPEADDGHAGCPTGARVDPDSDGDGVLDVDDLCDNEPKGTNEDRARRGCPAGDRDHDGVVDQDDWCPATAVRSDNTNTAPAANEDWPGCPEHTDRDPGTATNDRSSDNQPLQPTPPAPAESPAPTAAVATIAPALPTDMVAASRVATTLGNRTNVVTRVCTARTMDSLQAANGPCAANEPYCYRLVPHATLAPCNVNNMTPGCVMASRTIDPCVDGAERVVAIQCGSSLIGCTPENVATVAAREGERPTRERRTASRERRHHRDGYAPGVYVGVNNVVAGIWR